MNRPGPPHTVPLERGREGDKNGLAGSSEMGRASEENSGTNVVLPVPALVTHPLVLDLIRYSLGTASKEWPFVSRNAATLS